VNLNKLFTLSLALVTLVGVTAAGACAETITTFTLPIEAYWDSTLLQPGTYTLTVNKTTSGTDMIILRGEGVAARFLVPALFERASGNSRLELDAINGVYAVREFDVHATGTSYKFNVSKAVRSLTLRGAATQPVTIAVSAASGF
jgi:hypothetical protein